MSEGELKKRIRTLPDGKYVNVDAAFIRVGQVEKILDEAKKELDEELKTILKNAEQLDTSNQQERTMKTLLIMQTSLTTYHAFTKKWFGEAEQK